MTVTTGGRDSITASAMLGFSTMYLGRSVQQRMLYAPFLQQYMMAVSWSSALVNRHHHAHTHERLITSPDLTAFYGLIHPQ